jgi:hypothetical protein
MRLEHSSRFFAKSKKYSLSHIEGTELMPPSEQTPESTEAGWLGWIGEFRKLPDRFVLVHQSLDQYLYMRFLKMLAVMSFVGCCITWPILFPVNVTGGGRQSQLDALSFSNVQNPNLYYAHTCAAYLFLGE